MFKIGDRIVYPMHGAGIIDDIEEKEILGEKRQYFIMRMPIGDMKVMVPVDNVTEIGVRQIIDEVEMSKVMTILKGHKSVMPQNWNRRYRINMDRIKSGDIYEIASVVRNLMLLDDEKGLSTGERKMLNSAKQILFSEMVLVFDVGIDDVEKMVIEAINYIDDQVEEQEDLLEEIEVIEEQEKNISSI